MKTKRNSGVAIVEIILLLVFVGLAAGLGYVYFTNASKSTDTSQSSSQTDKEQVEEVEEVSSIDSTKDLDIALEELDSLEIDDSGDDSSLKSIESSL